MSAGPVLLRRLRAQDAAGIATAVAASMDHLRPWMPWATPEAADQRNQLARMAEADEWWESGTGFVYSVLTAGDGTLVGEIGLHRRADDNGAEIGYWITASRAGHGFGTAAASALTEVALALPWVTVVEIHCDEANTPSAAIARRLGYRLDRIEEREPEAPGECGRRMIWVRARAGARSGAGPGPGPVPASSANTEWVPAGPARTDDAGRNE